MQAIFARFLSFDRLLGTALVKFVYYVGAAAIAGVALMGLMFAVLALFGGNFGPGLMQLIAVPAVAAVGLVYWRFLCELFMLAFLAFDRLGEVRDLMRVAAGQTPPADPDHPPF